MAERYNFKYLPLVGKLPGKSMVEQTETAINELASVVYDNVGHVGNLAEEVQTANTNASNALNKATEALETSGRVYIKQIAAVDVNDYYDSELYYIDNDGSTNIPVRDRGFLEVKTNDDKTACEQVFIADSTGTPYYRHGRITEQTLGEETTYVVTWSSWYRAATTEYVQGELTNYLPLSGGTMTGSIQYVNNGKVFAIGNTEAGNVDLGWSYNNREGAGLGLRSTDFSNPGGSPGEFMLFARDANNDCSLTGSPSGNLTWNGKNLDYAPDYSVFNSYETFTAPTVFSNRIKVVPSGKFGGYKQVGKLVYVHYTFQMNVNMNKGAWRIAQGFPQAFNSGHAWTIVPLTVSAWYGDNESGYFTSAALDGYGALYLILSGNVTAGSSGDTNHGIVVHGVYLAK